MGFKFNLGATSLTYNLRIDNIGKSVNCSALTNDVWMRCSQRKCFILHMIRQPIINPIC